MRFFDVEAEEEEGFCETDEEEELDQAEDPSLEGFICDDDSIEEPEEEDENKGAKNSYKTIPLFDDEETFESTSGSEQAEDDFASPQPDSSPQRQIMIGNRAILMPPHISTISVVVSDGISAEAEIEPYELWKYTSARPVADPVFKSSTDAWPSDWFDELQICKDRRGSYCVRSTRTAVADTQDITFPSGKKITVPVKRVMVEHALFPYDEKVWHQSMGDPVVISESSTEDEIEPAPAKKDSKIDKKRRSKHKHSKKEKGKKEDNNEQPSRGCILSDEEPSQQSVLEKPKLKCKMHTASLKTSKHKMRRRKRLEMLRLKKDLAEEGDSEGLWLLSERRSKRQKRLESARHRTAAQELKMARHAGYSYGIEDAR